MEKRKKKKKKRKKHHCNGRCQTSVIHSRANPQKWGHTVDISIFRVIARSWANFRSSGLVIDVAPAILLPPSHWTPPRVSTHLDLLFVLLWQTTCKRKERLGSCNNYQHVQATMFSDPETYSGHRGGYVYGRDTQLGNSQWHRGIEVARRIWNTDSDTF